MIPLNKKNIIIIILTIIVIAILVAETFLNNPKEKTWGLKRQLPINKSGFINRCPNYNRVKTKAVSIEIKNLSYNCLKKEYLDEIIRAINNQQQV